MRLLFEGGFYSRAAFCSRLYGNVMLCMLDVSELYISDVLKHAHT